MHAMAIFLFYSMKLDNYITQLSEIIIVWTIDKTIGLRSNEQDELNGMDASYHGERGYDFS